MSEENTAASVALLNTEEARVLACLMEKHLTTPNNYPLTVNALMLACNQKSNREPVMNLTEGQVGHTAQVLAEREFARIEYGERANKISHRAPAALGVNREEQAVLCMLMLRAPMTLNDIKSRTERMVDFADSAAIQAVVEGLINRDEPLVVLIPKGAGRREDRYTHLLCGEPKIEFADKTPHAMPVDAYQQKIDELEARIEKLEAHLGLTNNDE